jgi:predicted flap endonuclease-1-like 5' DNA nuclease
VPVILEGGPAANGADAGMADAEAVEPKAAETAATRKKQRPAQAKLQPLFAAPAGPGDDLKKISGIGPVVEAKLKDLGITRFDQIAGLSDEDLEKVDTALNFKGRVQRDDWVGQARALADGA